jgi:predicted PurR-regulated permease PerM
MPFVLSGFLVFAVEPPVEMLYRFLAGLSYPYRWGGCCCLRRQRPHKHEQRGINTEGGHTLGIHGRNSREEEAQDAAKRQDEADSDAAATQPLIDRGAEPRTVPEGLCRFAAVTFMLCIMLLLICASVSLLVRGALHMKESWGAYQKGLQNWLRWLDEMSIKVSGKLDWKQATSSEFKTLYNYVLLRLQDMVSMIVNEIVSSVSSGVSILVMVFLYMLFWLLKPLPFDNNKASALVRAYLMTKTVMSLLYGVGVALLFLALGNDLAIFFGMVSFFLNFVPEVGAIISIAIPIPVILLDGRLEAPMFTLSVCMVGQLLLKLAINNVLELHLVEQDREMSIHPVWVLLNLNYFGYVWGPMGMLISVPMLAMFKSAALSATESGDKVTAAWADTLLAVLEGQPGAIRPGRRNSKLNFEPLESPAAVKIPADQAAGQQKLCGAVESQA